MAVKPIATFAEELRLQRQGYRLIAGVDEVGRGPLAGPVLAGAVVLDPQAELPFYPLLRDSKALTAAQRVRLDAAIRSGATAAATGSASSEEIDSLGIVGATRQAMTRAIATLSLRPDHLLIDALPLPDAGLPFRAIIKGDALCRSIAAASIIAKVARDALMNEMDACYPGYGIAQHKGYPTPDHLARLAELGPSPIHRRSFAPVRQLLDPEAHSPKPTTEQAKGAAAEQAAADYLTRCGCRLLARNYHCPWGEIDIVVQDRDGVVAFVEVKARRTSAMGTPAESVTRRKQQRLALAAQDYLQRNGLANREWRIDLVAVRLDGNGGAHILEHLPNVVGEVLL
ncbi:MAG: ribonuclease HII [Chloroflexi bacterium]|nr:ribonuclease HII [Chloroflexota bacterium]